MSSSNNFLSRAFSSSITKVAHSRSFHAARFPSSGIEGGVLNKMSAAAFPGRILSYASRRIRMINSLKKRLLMGYPHVADENITYIEVY
jgi:hypothetical protein